MKKNKVKKHKTNSFDLKYIFSVFKLFNVPQLKEGGGEVQTVHKHSLVKIRNKEKRRIQIKIQIMTFLYTSINNQKREAKLGQYDLVSLNLLKAKWLHFVLTEGVTLFVGLTPNTINQ